MKRPRSRSVGKVTFDTVRQLALTLPGVVESTSYGTPGFKVKKKLFARFHQDGESLVIHIEEPDRSKWMANDPDTYYITDHYVNYPWMLVRIARVRLDELQTLLAEAWRHVAPVSWMAEVESKPKKQSTKK